MPPCMTDTLMTPTYMLLILSIVSFVLQSVMVPMRSPNATEAMSHPGLQKEKNSWGVKYAQLWCAWHVSSLRIDGFPTPQTHSRYVWDHGTCTCQPVRLRDPQAQAARKSGLQLRCTQTRLWCLQQRQGGAISAVSQIGIQKSLDVAAQLRARLRLEIQKS